MIKFIERPYEGKYGYDNEYFLTPIYMVKDGQELFVRNRVDKGTGSFAQWNINKSKNETERIKKQLIANGGKYYKEYGQLDNPIAMLGKIDANGWTFTKMFPLYDDARKERGYVDFHGNLKEILYAFYYRIYDKDILLEVMEKVEKINERNVENE